MNPHVTDSITQALDYQAKGLLSTLGGKEVPSGGLGDGASGREEERKSQAGVACRDKGQFILPRQFTVWGHLSEVSMDDGGEGWGQKEGRWQGVSLAFCFRQSRLHSRKGVPVINEGARAAPKF